MAVLETKAIGVQPGAEASVRIKVQNTGQVVDELNVSVLGDPGQWASVAPPMVRLFPGMEEIVTVTFRPPKTAQTASGQVPFAVRVQSTQDPEGSSVEEGVLTVGAYAEATAELIPRNSRGSRHGTHELAVDNRGNAAMQASLSAADQDKLLDFKFSPATVTVSPGNAAFARLRVRPRQTFWRGQPKSRAFQVRVQPEGQPPISLDGTMLQGPLLAAWMVPAAMGAVGLIVAVALLWFLAVQPLIKSTARDAVKPTPVAATTGGGGGGGGGGKSPAPASPTAGSPAGSSAGGINFSQRLAMGQSYKAPANTTLYITDLVFQNPGSENGGQVNLQRDGVSLLTESPANYRDLDYHFVTPIQLNPNQTVALTGSCQQCSVLISGYEKTT